MLSYRCKGCRSPLKSWFRVEVAFAVDADGVCFQVVVADHESRVGAMDFHFFGVGDLGFDVVGADVEFRADLMGAELVENGAGVIKERSFIADREDADLFG